MSRYIYGNNGTTIEREYPMGEAPQVVMEDSIIYKRVLLAPTFAVSGDGRFKAWSLPTVHEMEPELRDAVPQFDPKDGAPLFASKAEREAFSNHSKRLLDQGKTNEAFVYGDAPSGAEVQHDRMEKGKKTAAEKMLE